eukprot:6206138-Pleurochrysis_carterae.AAC.6
MDRLSVSAATLGERHIACLTHATYKRLGRRAMTPSGPGKENAQGANVPSRPGERHARPKKDGKVACH